MAFHAGRMSCQFFWLPKALQTWAQPWAIRIRHGTAWHSTAWHGTVRPARHSTWCRVVPGPQEDNPGLFGLFLHFLENPEQGPRCTAEVTLATAPMSRSFKMNVGFIVPRALTLLTAWALGGLQRCRQDIYLGANTGLWLKLWKSATSTPAVPHMWQNPSGSHRHCLPAGPGACSAMPLVCGEV